MDNQLDLNLVRLFVAVVQCRNLSAAARRTSMTRSNASRQLKALERAVGAQLLRRTTRHTEVTEAGQILYAHSLRILEEAETACASIDSLGQTIRGDVRIRIPTGLGHLYLEPVLMTFARQHPDVSLRVLINDYIGDLVSAEVDLALKITDTPPEDHVARKLCRVEWCLVATPGYLEQAGAIASLEDLTRRTLITPVSLGRRFDLPFDIDDTRILLRVAPRLQSGDYPYLLKTALAGLGVALLPRYAVWRQLGDGTLREVLPDYEPIGVGNGLFLLTAPNRYPTLATRALMEYISQQIRDHEIHWRRPRPADNDSA
ncbi:LysR family transcriptional regulator [Allopusillimonas soli]|uniref:LysR family transcriptional regulator n=1 Tax=Allopusillimonas soli TaxID=659016 RepID=A0A853F6K7_9BURK|nr:LysR family transcriptional regulator [Allopusillimonas soli]NYT35478.1 LysR family transcriptional regulator [Allopusillimonas soli]TEA75890.1 LysR family transcriptional regulator [Allopusillimonas soli]